MKTERRFFHTRIRELEAAGVVEIVQVRSPRGLVKCIRLVNSDSIKAEDTEVPASEGVAAEQLEIGRYHHSTDVLWH